MLNHAIRRLLPVLAILQVAACGDAPRKLTWPGPRTVQLQAVSGDNQADTIGATLRPIIVRAIDREGKPVPGVNLRWSSAGVSGQFAAVTDSAGEAAATVTLGDTARTVTIGVTALDTAGTATGAYTPFTVTIRAGQATSGCGQQLANAVLTQAGTKPNGLVDLSSCLHDRNGNVGRVLVVASTPFTAGTDSTSHLVVGFGASAAAAPGDTGTVKIHDLASGALWVAIRATYDPFTAPDGTKLVRFRTALLFDAGAGGWTCANCVP